MRILDLFCGIGWGQALHDLGYDEIGYDLDADVCNTRAGLGWPTIRQDVTTIDPARLRGADLLIASPPCQSFSAAGKRAGLADARGQLVWQVERIALGARPRIVVCEQVPAVLSIWRMIGHRLSEVGYSWWAGLMSAERFGVPQTRERAILIARRDGRSPLPPEPTHREYVKGVGQDEGDPSLLPWVSMADALGWGVTARPGMTLAPGTAAGGPDIAGGSGARAVLNAERVEGRWVVDMRQKPPGVECGVDNITRVLTAPAPTFDVQSGGQWVLREAQTNGAIRPADTPAMTVSASADNGNFAWHRTRPATTICDAPRLSPPVHHAGSQNAGAVPVGEEGADKPIRFTVEQALILQSFPADFPLAGTKTAKFRLIGNSVAPRFAEALLAHVLDVALEAAS